MKDLKVITVFSGSAFVLSLVAGVLGAVSFPILLLRALLGVVFFGGLGFLVMYVLRKFLPELFDTGSVEEEAVLEEAGETVPKVDIVIDDEQESPSEGIVEEAGVPESGIKLEDEVRVTSGEAFDDMGDAVQEEDSGGLPNIESFSDAFNSAELEQNGEESVTGSISVDIMGQNEDPGTVAKAIRTIMKKDQEG